LSVTRVGVAGVGLIGGSIALRARANGSSVVGFDRDASTLERGLANGVIDTCAPDLEALAASCQILVIALPIGATLAALETLADRPGSSAADGGPGPALIIDVASVKAPFVDVGARVGAYIGTHPMAGSERGGIGAADANVFENATWAHMPHRRPDLVAAARAFIVTMGAHPLEIDAVRHDAIVALTSHLPQALSVALGAELAAAASGDRRVLELCGPGMASMLRLARSPAGLWSSIMTANAAPVAGRLRRIAAALEAAADGLESGESEPLMSYFESAGAIAGALEERISRVARSSPYPKPPHPHSAPPSTR